MSSKDGVKMLPKERVTFSDLVSQPIWSTGQYVAVIASNTGDRSSPGVSEPKPCGSGFNQDDP